MKPYASYKPSGVPWLGDVPVHWQVEKVKFQARLRGEKAVGTNGARYVGMEHVLSKVGKFNPVVDGTQEEAESTVNVFSKGDVLFGKLRPYLAKCVVADTDGVCSSEFLVLSPSDEVVPAYLNATMLMQEFIDAVDASTYGAKMPRADWGFIGQQRLPLPPPDEQQAIADYLDVETARIDTLIHEKDELIGLLKEARSGRISELISGDGLPGNATGDPWAPHLPEGWQFKRLKHLGQVRSGLAKGKDSGGSATVELPYLRVANVQEGRLDLREISTMPVEIDAVERFSLVEGDVLMNEGGDYDKVGRGAVWTGEISPCLHQNHVFAVRPVERDLSEWLSAITQTQYAKFYFMNNAKQSTNLASISQTTVNELPILLPPKAQRDALLGTLGAELAAFDDLIAHTHDEITLLKELRAATIADAVLGRIDVRTIPLACRDTP
ncbi:MAG: restriction endonuclease subunit S [Comamonas sp.]|uniref:restriction endonuclease subunit S n=1 Tax=Comamonas sp. TaxID=34028 RepID=UPI0026491C79|nr:restriction endonuclease subunit S [Comamonas sp.]MDN5502875.1 restriction endonuclease subunit S [Comamonas sp.]MDN5539087.1 restriction endonuclease subunit S [Comamonas sp.]